MKHINLLLLAIILFTSQIIAQTNGIVGYDTPTRDGHIKAGQTSFQETADNIELKKSESWGRIGFVEMPVNEVVAATKVEFEIEYYYTNKAELEVPVNISVIEGALAEDINWDNRPDSASFTLLAENMMFNDANYGVVTLNVTDFYNAALANGASHISFKLEVTDTDGLLRFYSSKKEGSEPKLVIESNCPRYTFDVDTLVCEGSTIQIGDQTVTENGTYVDSLTSECGADSVRIYHVLYIADGTTTVDKSICPEDSYTVITGPRSDSVMTEAGTYTIALSNGVCTQTTVINLSVLDSPVPNDLGNDIEIREGESLTLDAGAGFADYKWYNDTQLLDETQQTLEVDLEKEAFHTGINEIEVAVIDNNGCAGSDDIWVTIKGNLFQATKDCFIEEAGDRMVDISRIEVKNDLYGDQATPEGEGPFYSKELWLAFDLGLEEIPENIENVRLRLYLYGITQAPNVTQTVDMSIDCHYMDGLYSDAMTWSTLPATSERTQMAQPVNVNQDSIEIFVEWDINDIFMSDILGSKEQFSIVLTSYSDANSTLAKFKDISSTNPDLRPVIVYDVTTTNAEEKSVNHVNLYPNPANDLLYFNSDTDFTGATIYNIMGSKVMSIVLQGNSIDISSLEKGAYIIKLESNNRSFNKIIIKQ